MKIPGFILFTLLLTGLFPLLGMAEVRPAGIFTDNMVIQRDRPVPIWGSGTPGETVSVEWDGRSASASVGPDCRWRVDLEALPAGGPHDLVIRAGAGSVTLRNVMCGDVWLCAGQSNMAMPMREVIGADLDIPASKNDLIRFIALAPKASLEPLTDLGPAVQKRGWEVCGPSTTGSLSAVAYYFAREVVAATGIPTGLVVAAWGGTPIAAWTPVGALRDFDFAKPWLESREQAAQKIAENPGIFVNGSEVLLQTKAGTLFDGMIHPLGPLAIKGILWYQGEQNAGSGKETYTPVAARMVESWRAHLESPEARFYFVQLPNFEDRHEGAWPRIREAQMRCLDIPFSAMAVTIDLGEPKDIHPRKKTDVGRRLARIALAKDYNRKLAAWSGPLPGDFQPEPGAIRIPFLHIGSGLVSKDGAELREFEVAGSDQRFVPARAVIKKDAVIVWSPDVPNPALVRHAWHNNPSVNLFNKEGLPAAPFQSDDWRLPESAHP